jgi:tetratricopeptide (TPR) repeat protein
VEPHIPRDAAISAEVEDEHVEVGTAAKEALGEDALQEETITMHEAAEPLVDEHEELVPHDIHAVAEAADEAWRDALVEEEPAQVKETVHPVMEGMAEAADEIIGEVFGEKASDALEAGEGMFDLSSVMGEDIPQTPAQPQGTVDDLDEVLGSFRERIKAEYGEDAETHFNLGIAYKEMGLFRDAIHAFETAMKNGYSPSDCFNMIGLSFMDINEYGKAERVFREGLAQGGLQEHEKLGLSFDLGITLEKQDRLEDALEYYKEVEALNPHFRDVSQIVKRIAAKLKPKEVAEEPRVGMGASSRSKVSYI